VPSPGAPPPEPLGRWYRSPRGGRRERRPTVELCPCQSEGSPTGAHREALERRSQRGARETFTERRSRDVHREALERRGDTRTSAATSGRGKGQPLRPDAPARPDSPALSGASHSADLSRSESGVACRWRQGWCRWDWAISSLPWRAGAADAGALVAPAFRQASPFASWRACHASSAGRGLVITAHGRAANTVALWRDCAVRCSAAGSPLTYRVGPA